MPAPSPPCPTPGKRRHATREAAHLAADGTAASPYQCACSWWHLTSHPAPFEPGDLEPQDADAALLDAAAQSVFDDIVARDVRLQATLQEALALRHPRHLKRWGEALKALNVSVAAQLAQRAGDRSPEAVEWRRRLAPYQRGIAARRAECEGRARAYRIQRAEERRARPPRRSPREEAAQAAISRLIDENTERWAVIYGEERARRGLPAAGGTEKGEQDADEDWHTTDDRAAPRGPGGTPVPITHRRQT